MKTLLLSSLLLITQLIFAQNFTEILTTPFVGVSQSAVAFSDVDGDGDSDVLITGWDSSSNRMTKLYTNDGTGNYTEMMGTPFVEVINSSIAFSDVDGDGDSDVLITGLNSSLFDVTKLYINDGTGTFTEKTGMPFEWVQRGSIAFNDVDGDGDLDVLITGETSYGASIAELYTNNGNGTFTEVMGTPFHGVRFGSIAFNDVDGDGDADVLITGQHLGLFSVDPIAKLYTNDGTGNFTERMGTPFEGVSESSIAFSDVDGDGDSDVLITGGDDRSHSGTRLYENRGGGTFLEISNTPFAAVAAGSVAFSDIDRDGDSDVLITGRKFIPSTREIVAKLYTNNGSATFSEVIGTPFTPVELCSVAFSDIDGDGDEDVLITGKTSGSSITKLYRNETWATSIQKPIAGFSLYPNPASAGKVNLSFEAGNNSTVDIKLFDLAGRIISKQEAEARLSSILLDVSRLKKGLYIIEVNDGERKSLEKLLIH